MDIQQNQPARPSSGAPIRLIETSSESSFEARSSELKGLYRSTGNTDSLHQLGCLACDAGQFDQARIYFLAERQQIQSGAYVQLADNAYEMGRLAQLRGEPFQAILYVRASLRYARLGQSSGQEKRSRQLLAQLMLLMNESPALRDAYLSFHSA